MDSEYMSETFSVGNEEAWRRALSLWGPIRINFGILVLASVPKLHC